MSKLLLCAGNRRLEGFESHDVLPLEGLTYRCEFFDIPKTITKKFSEVHFTHAIEHFPVKQTQIVLKVIRDLLEDGGKLYIEVPNFAWHAQLVSEGRDRDAVYYAFGGQLDEWDFHKAGFTISILFEELTLAGFRNISIRDGSSLQCHCEK
jgi:hypothetical protein